MIDERCETGSSLNPGIEGSIRDMGTRKLLTALSALALSGMLAAGSTTAASTRGVWRPR
jgi:hypothetical protein